MKKNHIFLLVLSLAVTFVLGACNGSGRRNVITGPDSIYSYREIALLLYEDADSALARIDVAEDRRFMRIDSCDFLRGVSYMHKVDYVTAMDYIKKAANYQESIDEVDFTYFERLNLLAMCYKALNKQDSALVIYTKGIEMAHEKKDKFNEGSFMFDAGTCIENTNKKDGINYMKRGLKLVEEANRQPLNLVYMHIQLMRDLIEIDQFEEALEHVDPVEKLFVKIQEEGLFGDGAMDAVKGAFYFSAAYSYGSLKKMAEADEYMKKFDSTMYSKTTPGISDATLYYRLVKDYKKVYSLGCELRQMLSTGDTVSTDYEMALKLIIDACNELNNKEEYCSYLTRAYMLKDSIVKREKETRVLELAQIYKTQEKDIELHDAQNEAKITRVIMIAAIAILIAVAIICLIIWRNHLQLKKKNRALVESITQMLDAKAAQKILESQQHVDEKDDNNNDGDDSQNVDDDNIGSEIRKFLDRLMANNLFCDADFDRDGILDELHIQRRTFARNFETFTGVSYSQYLMNLRLEYAVDCIRRHPEYTIDAIAADSGFASRSTFYRNFSDHFGITPTAFRNNL